MAISVQEKTWRERMALKRAQFLGNRVKDTKINNALKSLQHKTAGYQQEIKKVQSSFFGFAPGSPANRNYQYWRREWAGGKELKYLKRDAQGNIALDEEGKPKYTAEGIASRWAGFRKRAERRGISTRTHKAFGFKTRTSVHGGGKIRGFRSTHKRRTARSRGPSRSRLGLKSARSFGSIRR
jgi:hypothetical protein